MIERHGQTARRRTLLAFGEIMLRLSPRRRKLLLQMPRLEADWWGGGERRDSVRAA